MRDRPTDTLFLIWREPASRAQYRIGELSYDGFNYHFRYDVEGVVVAERHGFSLPRLPLSRAFKELDKKYTSKELFPAIAHRLPDPRRPDYTQLLERFKLQPGNHPFEILRRTRGRLATDELSFEEAPVPTANGQRIDCYVAGWRFYSGDTIIDRLVVGAPVQLKHDDTNQYDPSAVAVYASTGEVLGYVPVFHSNIVAHALSTNRRVTATIAEINPPPASTSDRVKISIVISPRLHARDKIRQKLETHRLPRGIPDPLHPTELEGFEPIIIGPGHGQTCSACDEVIGRDDRLSIEFHYPTNIVRFHRECFELWNELRREKPGVKP